MRHSSGVFCKKLLQYRMCTGGGGELSDRLQLGFVLSVWVWAIREKGENLLKLSFLRIKQY